MSILTFLAMVAANVAADVISYFIRKFLDR